MHSPVMKLAPSDASNTATLDVPDSQKPFTALNAELSKLWKPIIERKPGPPDADEWKDVPDKLKYLER